MGCLKLSYYEQERALEVNPNFYLQAVGKNGNAEKNRLSSSTYGFNGQEGVSEISGSGNHYTAEFWEYDPRTGRRWNLDPVIRPWESGYAVMGGNPIWNKDPNGDDFVNANTKKREAAEAKKNEAASNLESAKSVFKPFEGVTRKEAKAAGNLDEFQAAKSGLKSAQKSFDRADAIFKQEVENEATVNAVLEKFKEVNPEVFAEFDKFDPFGRGVIDIEVSAQKGAIQMLDSKGFPTGRTTVEGIHARLGSPKKQNDFVKVRLQVIKVDDVIKIQSITGSFVHALGHIQGGQSRNETEAVKFEQEQFQNKLKK